MDEENNVCIEIKCVYNYSVIKKEKNLTICRKVDGTKRYHVRFNKPGTERQVVCGFSHIWERKKENLKGEVGSSLGGRNQVW